MTSFRTKLLTLFLITLFVVTPVGLSLSTGLKIQRLQAAGGVQLGELGKGFVAGAASCVVVAVAMKYISAGVALMPAGTLPQSEGSTPVKKAIDCILYQVVNTIIEDIIKSVTTWAQSGFEGNPVFVTNVAQHMLKTADATVGQLLLEKAPLLCSPFKAQIQLALMQSYQQNSGRISSQCSLTGAVSNIDDFMNGDFNAGGWNGWVEMVSNPYNNPYGAYLETDMEMKIRLINAVGEQTQDISLGSGFLSKKVQDCYAPVPEGQEGPPAPAKKGDPGVKCDPERTVTPGTYIQEQVAKTTGLQLDRLTFADELNEMITALMAYLIRDVLLGEKGLAGYDPADFADDAFPKNLPSATEIPSGTGGVGASCQASPEDTNGSGAGDPISYSENGTFFTTTADDTVRDYYFGDESRDAKYTKVVVGFDVKVGEFTSIDGSYNYHELFYLSRGDEWWNNLIGEVGLKIQGADGSKLVTQAHLAGACKETQSSFEPAVGDTLHVEYTYDTLEKVAGVDIKSGNDIIASAWAGITADVIENNNQSFHISIGGVTDDNGEYQVKLGPGWEFSNLNVEMTYVGEGIQP
jgi:hypothetical protein